MTAESVHYPYPYRAVFDSACAVLPRLGYRIGSADPATGLIMGSAPVSAWSWGESIYLRIGSASPNDTEVLIGSDLRYGIIDTAGRNQLNVNRIHYDLNQYVAWYVSQNPPSPDEPAAPSQ